MTKIILTAVILLRASILIAADSATENCREIESDEARLACYDEITSPGAADEPQARDAATATSATAAATAGSATRETAPVTGTGPADISPEDMFGRTADETTRMLEESMDVESLDALEATVEQMTRDRFGKLSITLSNRQTWKQSDSSRMNLRVGDEVRIERAALGSYLLEKKSGSTSIRVKRIE